MTMPRRYYIDNFIFLIILSNLKILCRANKTKNNHCVDGCATVRKCCPLSYDYVNKTCVVGENDFERDLKSSYTFDIDLKFGHECGYNEISVLLSSEDPTIEFRILKTGELFVASMSNFSLTVGTDKYCLDYINDEDLGISALLCQEGVEDFVAEMTFGMIISMPFLLITFLVYAILPDRNLHQRALMFYVLALLVSYILLVTINLSENLDHPWCEIFAYSTLFFFMVSFFWMNVICFDIWYTFSGGRGFVGSKRTSERRRLIYYSLYAFGVPLLVVLIVFFMQKILPENSPHNPGIGTSKCFLADGWPNLWYFYGQAGILVIMNIIFFMLTALKIRQVKKETSMLKQSDSKRHNYEKDKQKFNLYVKLLFAMGVNWSMEVISWLVNWRTEGKVQYIWYATDFFNAVYGVFIFFIFVFKKKIWKLLQRRYYNFIGKPHLAHTMTSTNTRTSHYSSTVETNLSDRSNATNGRARNDELALRRINEAT